MDHFIELHRTAMLKRIGRVDWAVQPEQSRAVARAPEAPRLQLVAQ